MRNRWHRVWRLLRTVFACLLLVSFLSACSGSSSQNASENDPVYSLRDCIGEESFQNPSSILLYEQVPDVGEAVVYHKLTHLDAFLRLADRPVWLFLHNSLDPVFSDLTLFCEQLTEAYQGRIYVLLLEEDLYGELVQAWNIRQLPYMALYNQGKRLSGTDQVSYPSLREAKEQMDKWVGFVAPLKDFASKDETK